MAREMRVTVYVNGQWRESVEFSNFRDARDWAEEEATWVDEDDFKVSVEQRRLPGAHWEEMVAFGPAAPVSVHKNSIHVCCVLCYARFVTSRSSLSTGVAQCPKCGASAAIEEI